MANPKSSGSGPGVEDARPPASVIAEVSTLEQLAELVDRIAASIASMRRAAAEQMPSAAAVSAAAADVGKAKDQVHDDDDDVDSRLGVEDIARNGGPWGFPPLKAAIEGLRRRLSLADSVLAGVDADLDAEEGHLEAERLTNGDHQAVICLARRILNKSVDELDTTVIGRLVEQAVATALEMHAAGAKDFDPYDDTPEMHANKRAASARLAAQEERPASGS